MKTQLFFIFSIFFFFVLPFKAVAQENKTFVLFVDKSMSLKDEATKLQDQFTYKLLKQHFKAPYAEVEVRFLNNNTASIAHKTFLYKESIFQPERFKKSDLELQKVLHKSKVKRSRKKLAKTIANYIKSFPSESPKTEILSSLSPLSKLKNHSLTQVVYISDMLESSNIRDMNRYKFRSEKETILGAQSDFKKIQKIFLLKKLENFQITCVIPVQLDNQDKAFQFVQVYWTTIFEMVGIKKIKFIAI